MPAKRAQNLMFSQALGRMARLDDMRRLSFDLGSLSAWEPPLDLIETPSEVVAYVALPGVDTSEVEVTTEERMLVLSGRRNRPPEWRSAGLLRVELPWGPFERRVQIPRGCRLVKRMALQGYLVVHLRKAGSEPMS